MENKTKQIQVAQLHQKVLEVLEVLVEEQMVVLVAILILDI